MLERQITDVLPVTFKQFDVISGKEWCSPYFQLLWTQQQSFECVIGDQRRSIPRSRFLLVRPMQAVRLESSLLSYIQCLNFDAAFLQSAGTVLSSISLPVNDYGKRLLNLVLSCKQQSLDSALRIRLSCLLFSLLSECFMQVRPTEDSAKKQPKAAPGPSQRKKSGRPIVYAVRYMRRHLSNPDLSLLEIAGAVGYNPNYFCQEFSQIFGVSPIRHLNEMRVLRALRYLDETELRIQEICKHVGIRNPGNFTHMVKLKVGMTPMEYRRDQRSRSMQANPPLETGAPGGG